MGPVLFFRGVRGGSWLLAALVSVRTGEDPPPLVTPTGEVGPHQLADRCGRAIWRYDFALPLAEAALRRSYRIGDRSWPVQLPGASSPLRIAFTACNGSEEGDAWATAEKRNRLWIDLWRKHRAAPFHLLIQGGDQLYADPVWRDVPALFAWRRQPWRKRRDAPFTSDMRERIRDFYFQQYCRVWEQRQLAPVLAEIPSLMMWDDHDITDGWGSYPGRSQECDVVQGIWRAAREHFALFQLAAPADNLPEGFCDRRGSHFGWAYRVGDVGIVAPDLRSERNRQQVLGERGRRALRAALASMSGCSRILLVCTVPLVNAHFHTMERLYRFVPGHQSWEDDLVDQWPSLAHRQEWAGLLQELVAFSAETGVKITSLSGEVHLGALGRIESPRAHIYQLTSSGIVHPPPSRRSVMTMELVSPKSVGIPPDIEVRALRMPGSRSCYLRARNWMELEIPAQGPLLANWHPESGPPLRLAL